MVQAPRRKIKDALSDGAEQRCLNADLRRSDLLWRFVSAGFGALVVLGFLMPVDAVSVFAGDALPQNFGWLALSFAAAFAARSSLIAYRISQLEIVLLTAIFCWLLGCTYSVSRFNDGRAVWNSFWQLMALAGCYYIGRALLMFTHVRSATWLILLVGCTGLAMDGLQQVFVTLPATRREFEKDPESMLTEQGIDAPPGSPRRKQFEDRLYSPEPFATFALANSLGTLLSFGVLLTSGWLAVLTRELSLKSGSLGRSPLADRVAIFSAGVALLVQLACLLLTRSRSAYLALLLALGLWLTLELLRSRTWLTLRWLRFGGLTVAAVVLFALAWLFSFDQRVLSEASKSLGYRLEYWQATIAMIRDHAITGVGLGNFQAYYPSYKVEQASEIIADPHNWILDIAATLSLPVAGLIIGWVVVTLAMGMCRSVAGEETVNDANFVRQGADLDVRLAHGMLLGAAVGGSLEMLFLWSIGNFDARVDTLSWTLAVAIGWSIWRAGTKTQLSFSCFVATASAPVIALLVSGSWQASGIAIPFLCVCATLWAKPLLRSPAAAYNPVQANVTGGRWIATGFAILGCMIFGFQTWQPVMNGWMWSVQAESARSLPEQQRLISEAAASDSLNRGYRLQLAQIEAAQAEIANSPEDFSTHARLAMEQIARAMATDTASPTAPKVAGQICLDLAATATKHDLPLTDHLIAAKGFYSTALERYPSSVELMVQYSVAVALAGDWQIAAATAQEAIALSNRIPHLDKKLEAQRVWLPLNLPGFDATSVGTDATGRKLVHAEPLANWLRKQAK